MKALELLNWAAPEITGTFNILQESPWQAHLQWCKKEFETVLPNLFLTILWDLLWDIVVKWQWKNWDMKHEQKY